MNNIKKRFKEIELPESTKRIRLGRYYNLMKEGYSPNEIFNKIKKLSVEEAYVYYHLCEERLKKES